MRQIRYKDLDDVELDEFEDFALRNPFESVNTLREYIIRGDLELWKNRRLKILLHVREHGLGKALHIWGVFGSDLVRSTDDFNQFIRLYAKLKGCRWVTCNATRGGIEKLLDDKRVKSLSQLYVMEVADA